MPDLEPLTFPSREETSDPDVADVQDVCSGRRHPRVFLSSPSASITRAVHHIQETKRMVETWGKENEPAKMKSFLHGGAVVSVELSIEGVTISARETSTSWSLLRNLNNVLVEVVQLVERLESDRQYAQEALDRERRRRKFLLRKLDTMAGRRQKELAAAVHRAHQYSLPEIARLKVQLEVERKYSDEAQEKLSYTEALMQHIQEDIDFAKKQIPIMDENLDLEMGHVDQLSAVLAEAIRVLRKAKRDLRHAEEELRQTEQDAVKERTMFSDFILARTNQLDNKLNELERLKALDEHLCAVSKETECIIAQTEKKCATIVETIPKMTESVQTESDWISPMNLQIEEEIQKNQKLKERLRLLEADIKKRRRKGEALIWRIEQELLKHCRVHSVLISENVKLQGTLDDCHNQTQQSEEAVKLMRFERRHMLLKTDGNQQQFEDDFKELVKITSLHKVASEHLEEVRLAMQSQEKKFQDRIEHLRKYLSELVAAQGPLKAECESLHENVKQQQENFEPINQQLRHELRDLQRASEALHSHKEELKALREHLEMLQNDHKQKLTALRTQERLERERLSAAQDLERELTRRRENAKRRIIELEEQTLKYHENSDTLEIVIEKIPAEIEELKGDLDLVESKNRAAAALREHIDSQITEKKLQANRSKQRFSAQLTEQRKREKDTTETLRAAVKENSDLACNYTSGQDILKEAKLESANTQNRRNRAHQTFLYFKRMLGLQKSLHETLVSNLKRRNWVGRMELDRCLALTVQADRKLEQLQVKLL